MRLALVVVLASSVCGQETERLRSGRWRVKELRFGHALPEGKTAVEKPEVRTARVNRLQCFFLDLDGDGRFDGEGVDGWALSGMNYILPFEKTVVMELDRVTWSMDEECERLTWKAEPLGVPEGQEKVFRQFNYWRLINGLPPVDYDPKLSKWCNEHCAWMEKNGFKHAPEEGDGPLSTEAAHAGMNSMLSQEKPGMSVLMLYASFYHRLPLFRPGTRAIGIGCSQRYTSIAGTTRREPRAWQHPIVVPAPNSGMQPTHFVSELPRPHPPGLKNLGFPITLTFDRGTITEARATLRWKRGDVPFILSSPELPANKRRPDNRMTSCLIPRNPLRPRTLYGVEVKWKRDGEDESKRWIFKTGHPRPVWAPAGR